MKLKGIKFLLFSATLILFLGACGNSKKLGTPTGLDIVPVADARINYGHSFSVRIIMNYSSGAKKDITDKGGVELNCFNHERVGNEIFINGYPIAFGEDEVRLEATYTKKDISLSKKVNIPFNYKGDLELTLNGNAGENGGYGSSGGTALLFRHGKDGDDGYAGGIGENGHDLSVHIYKDSTGMYKMRVIDVNTEKAYYYTNRDLGFGIKFYNLGGPGGMGGQGGDGGDGKDGVEKNGKTKSPGSGGDGGNGGIGGQGGDGGTLFLFIHTNCQEIVKRIAQVNIGGPGGEGGSGGRGGKAGTPLEGQEANESGSDGYPGDVGANGNPGPAMVLSVEEFEIDF